MKKKKADKSQADRSRPAEWINRIRIPDIIRPDFASPWHISIEASGNGAPGHEPQLRITLEGKRVNPLEIRKTGESAWRAELPEFLTAGEFIVQVHVLADGRRISSNPAAVIVIATPEQLWETGQFARALIRDPQRTEWLDQLEQTAENQAGFDTTWLNILEQIKNAHPANADINHRYQRIRGRIKRQTDRAISPPAIRKKESPRGRPRSFWAALILYLMILIAVTVFYFGR